MSEASSHGLPCLKLCEHVLGDLTEQPGRDMLGLGFSMIQQGARQDPSAEAASDE